MRIGIDTGGTFTDGVAEDGRRLKVRSVKGDPSAAVAAILTALAPPEAVDLVHGTTVATNAVLEGRLAPVGLLTNRGFETALLIGRQAREDLYALEPARAPLPLRPEHCRGVAGRLLHDGRVEEEPVPAECRRAGRELRAAGVQAFAVLFLHSYRDPSHEEAAGRALLALGLPVTLSSHLDPQFREVERGTTCVLNAALRPGVEGYLRSLAGLIPAKGRVRVIASDGGLWAPEEVAPEPVRLLLSGPAGGLLAAAAHARAIGERRVLTLDMGGTSTDVAFLEGRLLSVPEMRIAGHTVRVPALPMTTVGAGGGSLALPDAGGALRVGPESAGSDPGPAALGTGDRITVTDAHLLLGHLPPDFYATGAASLDLDRARRVAEREARRFGLRTPRFLRGVLELADLAMARALRVMSVARGRDPQGAALLVFGGAGGLHGVSLARALAMRRVLVPPDPGTLAAEGLLRARPLRTRVRAVLARGLPPASVRRRLVRELSRELRELLGPARRIAWHVGLDLRYLGQSYEIEIPEGPDPAGRFHAEHARRFGFSDPSREIETVSIRVRAVAAGRSPPLPRLAPRQRGRPAPEPRPPGAFPVFDREGLLAGDRLEGPAIVADRTGTTLLPEGARLRVHATGALLIETGA